MKHFGQPPCDPKAREELEALLGQSRGSGKRNEPKAAAGEAEIVSEDEPEEAAEEPETASEDEPETVGSRAVGGYRG